ncbi:programmed cell death protein 4-like [Acanthaster planci]|uniref:Programmed cell death protein 4 n=1 Tax=Acanthaster planci TaxID=133434 RepID=A0A8B7YF31_ACAPL|nr:programmed cell death protein 4-like [Acanthaster planci]
MEVDAQVVDFVEQNGDLSNDDADTNNNPSGEGDGMNGGPLSALEGRITRKAKRRLRKSPSKETPPVPMNGVVAVSQREKNMRKSRSGRGRGLPKKGGAGGKGTWGPPGLYEENDANCQDVNDPNYDSDAQAEIALKAITPKLRGEELQDMVEPIIQEYFEHGDTDEVAACLSQLNIDGSDRHEVASVAVTLAMEKKDPEKEMTSVLLSDLYGLKVVSEIELEAAFENLLHSLPDLSLDTPEAPSALGKFIARAIADDCLAPRFVQKFKEDLHEDHMSHRALDGADLLLNMKHGMLKLDNVWGVGGGRRPVKVLIKKMVLLLKEYLSSGDIQEAIHCLKDLDVPHFHHELVYEAVYMVLEQFETVERVASTMAQLLKTLFDSNIITIDQMNTGFRRIFTALPDIVIDVPHAFSILEKFADISRQQGFISAQLRAEVPTRVRKRFVSEGDGGRLKE